MKIFRPVWRPISGLLFGAYAIWCIIDSTAHLAIWALARMGWWPW